MIPQPIDQVPLFQGLTEEERELLNSRLRHLQFNANDLIFSAGKPAEFMGVIVQGWVKLEGDPSQSRFALANLGAGGVIGDVDLLLGQPHSTSARAASLTGLVVLNKQDLQELILQSPTIGLTFSSNLGARIAFLDEYLVTQRLGSIPILSALSEHELNALAARLEFQSFPRGETLFQSGEEGTAIHIVERGHVRLITNSPEGEHFEEIGEGQMLGQTALITGKAYNSTAVTLADTQTWRLQRTDFQDLISQLPTLKLAFARSLAETLDVQDQVRAVEHLRTLPLFADVDAEALNAIAASLVLRQFPEGVTIYAEGTPGDAMYFVEGGQVALVSESSGASQALSQVSSGETFGEMALLTGRTRAEAARADVDTTVWVLYKTSYDDLIVRHPSLSLALSRALSGRLGTTGGEYVESRLNSYRLLGGLSPYDLKHIGEFVKPLRFRPGETICQVGQSAQYIYLVSKGQVREVAGGSNGQAIVVDLMQEGDSFGERAVVQSTAYPTMMQAVGEVECLTLGKPDFDRLVARYPKLALNLARRMAEEADKAALRPQVRPPTPRPTPPQRIPPSPAVKYAGGPRPAAPRPAATVRSPSLEQPVPVAPVATTVGIRSTQGRAWEQSTTNVVRPMPAASTRPAGANPPSEMAESIRTPRVRRTQARPGIVDRILGLSPVGKIALGVSAFIAFWLLVIVPLYFVISWLGSATGFSGLFSTNPSSRDLPANIQGSEIQQSAMAQVTGKLALRVRTATPTPVPPTAAPTGQPTARPTAKRVAPTAAKPKTGTQIQAAPAPTEAVIAAAAPAAPRLPLPPRQWDPRLGPGGQPLLQGIGVRDASAASGQTFWRLTKMVFQDAGTESGNDHTIYVTLLDENRQRVSDQSILVSWDESGVVEEQHLGIADQKPQGDYCQCNYNWPMYGAGYRVRVDGSLPSDEVYGMIMPMHRHVNYLLTFQRVVMP